MKLLRKKLLSGESKPSNEKRDKRGFTIVEITVVLAVMLILMSVSVMSFYSYRDWKLGSEAGTKLRTVYTAQRTYLAEHPTETPATLTEAKLLPYFSGKKEMPTIEDLNGDIKSVNYKVSPPLIGNPDETATSGYDPSPKKDDGLWDVGK